MAELVNENARKALDQDAYLQQFTRMKAELEALTAKRARIELELLARYVRKMQIGEFIDMLGSGLIVEFHEEVFRAAVDTITVSEDRGLSFRFVDGKEIKVE